MEEEQARHSRSDHPDVLLRRLVPVMVYNRKRGLVNLYIIGGEYYLLEFQIKRFQKFADGFEPTSQCLS